MSSQKAIRCSALQAERVVAGKIKCSDIEGVTNLRRINRGTTQTSFELDPSKVSVVTVEGTGSGTFAVAIARDASTPVGSTFFVTFINTHASNAADFTTPTAAASGALSALTTVDAAIGPVIAAKTSIVCAFTLASDGYVISPLDKQD